MALITRVSRLFQADFHAVLDRIEEPEVLLRQAVREMEEELARDEQRSKMLTHEQRQLVTRETGLKQSLHDIDEELDTCFAAGNDELARACIRRKLEAQRFGKPCPANAGRSGKRSMNSTAGSGKTRRAWKACGKRPNCWPGKATAPDPRTTGASRTSPSAMKTWKSPSCAKNSTGAGHETAHIS